MDAVEEKTLYLRTRLTKNIDGDRNIDTIEFETLNSDVLQLYNVRKQLRIKDEKVTKQARLLYLLEDEFETNPIMRIVIPPSHRYQAMLSVHAHKH